jgi:general L-amino acid transport system substrate-binding protein
MKSFKLLAAAAAATLVASTASAGTLDDVRARGELKCGVSTGLIGFAFQDDTGRWGGFDAEMCRAVAVAIFGDQDKVSFTPTTSKERFTVLQSGEIDMLARNTTWTFSRDVNLGLEFVGVNYYDGQGFMVPKSLGVTSAENLDGATVCVQTGTTTELNLADYFASKGMSYEPVIFETNDEIRKAYEAGRCDIYTTDASGLAAQRAAFADPSAHVVLPEIISKEPLGPLVRHGDSQWGDVVRWTLNAMISAEELGVNSGNVAEMGSSKNKEILRLLGVEGDLGEQLGLSNDSFANVISTIGNYAESFNRTIGPDTAVGMERNLNALWTNGGILYSPPFR